MLCSNSLSEEHSFSKTRCKVTTFLLDRNFLQAMSCNSQPLCPDLQAMLNAGILFPFIEARNRSVGMLCGKHPLW